MKSVEEVTTDAAAVLETTGVTKQQISDLRQMIGDLNDALQYQAMLEQLAELTAKAQTMLGSA